MKLGDFIVTEAVIPQLKSETRDNVIRELVEALAQAGKFDKGQVDGMVAQTIAREEQGSTGIGKGIAVPHIKHAAVTEIVGAIGCSAKGVDFASLDKAPVHSVVLLISPTNNPEKHLEAMEKLFSHLQRDMFRKWLRQAETVEGIIELIQEADEAPKGQTR